MNRVVLFVVVAVVVSGCARVVEEDEAPVAVAGADLVVNAGVVVTFDGGASTDDDAVASYDWDFGDGSVGAGTVVDHIYVDAGGYVATLTVTDTAGQEGTDTVVVQVSDVVAVARIVVDGGAGVGDEFVFDATTSSSPGLITQASWRFGDGGTADGDVVRHAYAAAGSFTVRLAIVDDAGNDADTSVVVDVAAADVAGTWDVGAASFNCASYAAVFPDDVLVLVQDGVDVTAQGGDGRVYAGAFDASGLRLRGPATIAAGGCGAATVDVDWRSSLTGPDTLSGTATAFFDLGDNGCQCTAAWDLTATRRAP